MLNCGNTLHFINRVDETNCGDWVCCPLMYYFDFFKNYSIIRHDIRYIDFDSIAPTDVVIIGGGGMFDYSEFINRAINRLLDIGATVIAWSPGLNTHSEYDGTFQTKINYEKFEKINLRDYNNNYALPYLPDVTCKLPGLKNKYTVKRKYGIVRHKDYPIKDFEIYDEITNCSPIEDILRFIGETETVFSNSFHLIYWATLMGKKTVCIDPFSSKFYSYKYKPEYCNEAKDNISECVNMAQNYDIIDECIKANDDFFEQVKEIIEKKLTPSENGEANFDLITNKAIYLGRIRDMQMSRGDILVSQLYIDDGTGYLEERKRVAINNVLGDDECFVKFDISEYTNIKELRFDPIERQFCKVKVFSSVTDTGSVDMIPEVGVNRNGTDFFLNSDPQYFIKSPCHKFLEIRFKLNLLNNYESEQLVRDYVNYQNNNSASLNTIISNQNAKLNELSSAMENNNTKFNEQNSIIENQNAKINEQNSIIENQNKKLNEQASIIENQNTQLNEQNSIIENQSAKLNEQNSFIESQNARLNEQNSIIDGQNAKLNEKDSIIDSQNTRLNEQNSVIDKLNQNNDDLTAAINLKTSEAEERDKRIEVLSEEIRERASTVDSLQQQLEHTKNELSSLYNSRSWKITAPLRKIFSFFRRLFKGEKAV